jgi:hypothetical protein
MHVVAAAAATCTRPDSLGSVIMQLYLSVQCHLSCRSLQQSTRVSLKFRCLSDCNQMVHPVLLARTACKL